MVSSRRPPAGSTSSARPVPAAPTYLFLAFIVVTFCNLPSRIPVLGYLRPTVLFIGILALLALMYWQQISDRAAGPTTRWLTALIVYILLSLPFVEWPGSVINKNFEIFLRGAVFYFFTVLFVDTEQRLAQVIATFVATQLWRVIEPLWLHVTTGYWGSATYVGWETMMDRLSGAPADTINPNGLAFVIVTIMPFLHYWATHRSGWGIKAAYLGVTAMLLYALLLTSSRSGFLAMVVVLLVIIWFSKRKVLLLSLIAGIALVTVPMLSQQQLERYQSLYKSDVAGSGTAQGRVEGIEQDFVTFSNRPIFGHGLGTSLEANFNVLGGTHFSHNLYTESLIELGAIGAAIFLIYLLCVCRQTHNALRVAMAHARPEAGDTSIFAWLPRALIAWVVMCLVFSLASYGISEYHWYFFGGLSLVTYRLAAKKYGVTQASTTASTNPVGHGRVARRKR